jgi:hypothetical protein
LAGEPLNLAGFRPNLGAFPAFLVFFGDFFGFFWRFFFGEQMKKFITMTQPQVMDSMERASNRSAAKDAAELDCALVFGEPPSRVRNPIYMAAHPSFARDFTTHRNNLVRHAAVRLGEALDMMKKSYVTIAIDGGTVWSHYLCVVVLSHSHGALTIGLPRCTGSMTATWVRDKIHHICEHHFKKRLIRPLCCIADNASNMQAAIRGLDIPMLETKCLIHSAQLVINDYFAQQFEERAHPRHGVVNLGRSTGCFRRKRPPHNSSNAVERQVPEPAQGRQRQNDCRP